MEMLILKEPLNCQPPLIVIDELHYYIRGYKHSGCKGGQYKLLRNSPLLSCWLSFFPLYDYKAFLRVLKNRTRMCVFFLLLCSSVLLIILHTLLFPLKCFGWTRGEDFVSSSAVVLSCKSRSGTGLKKYRPTRQNGIFNSLVIATLAKHLRVLEVSNKVLFLVHST